MSVLLQISDPHFGTEQPHVVEALVAMAQSVRPDAVVLSGDITQRARRAEFESARRFLDRLSGPPMLVLPGNHDIPLFNLAARIVRPYGNHQRSFGRQLEPEIDTPDFRVIGVNTTRAWRHKDGAVSAAQIARVSRRLRGARHEQLRIVVTHQPLHVPNQRDAHNLLHGREAAARAWAAAGADLVMGGHIHLPFVRPPATGCVVCAGRHFGVVQGALGSAEFGQRAALRRPPDAPALHRGALGLHRRGRGGVQPGRSHGD